MALLRILITTLLLTYTGHSMALFMPESFTISSESTAVPDEGCGVITTRSQDHLAF